jgi:hypothetical protein
VGCGVSRYEQTRIEAKIMRLPAKARVPYFRSPPPTKHVKKGFRAMIMISRPPYITKRFACPSCGVENRIQFDSDEMIRELPCSHCAAIIGWKRRPLPEVGPIQYAIEDFIVELAL